MRRLALVCVLTLCGCGTVSNLTNTAARQPFGGVAEDVLVGTHLTLSGDARLLLLPLVLADFPLSLAGDVATLPLALLLRPAEGPIHDEPQVLPGQRPPPRWPWE